MNGTGPCRMGEHPGIGTVTRVMNIAAFYHGLRAFVDTDTGIIINYFPIVIKILTQIIFSIELLPAHSSPSRNIAVNDTDRFGFLNIYRIPVASDDDKVFQNN